MKVLIAEDSGAMRGIVRQMMLRLGYDDIIEAADGQEAWEQLVEQSFDLLLTDWNMPRMSGLELLQKIRETPDMAGLPVVMLTTRNNKQDIVSAMKAGINNYITKPCKPTQLKDKIDKALIHAAKKNQRPASAQRPPDELLKGGRKHHPAQRGPYVLCYEAPADMNQMLQRGEPVLVQTYEAVVGAIEHLNEEYPGLDLGYSIEDNSKECTRLVNLATEPIKVLMISARRPEGFSLARLTGFKHATRIPIYLVCDSLAALPSEQRAAAANVGLELIERRDFEARNIAALLRDHLVPQVQTAASGLQYRELITGRGKSPAEGNTVRVHYTGMLDDGSIFDSSHTRQEPFEFRVGGGLVIDGWDEGVRMMRTGGKALLTIPPDLAYGAEGDGAAVPPNATLVFNVELLAVKEGAADRKVKEDAEQ